MPGGNVGTAADSQGGASKTYVLAFALTTSLFFMWAIAHNLNDILIRQFEKALQLSRAQASFIQVAFYVAYFVFAIPAGFVLRRIGLRGTMVFGLLLFAIGAASFYPAAEIGSYGPFLAALFVIASGIVCLEIAAGAFMVLAGPARTSAFRINLAQAFNGVGSVVAPLIGARFIFSGRELSAADLARMSPAAQSHFRASEVHQVQLPYLAIAGVTLLIAAALSLVRYPPEQKTEAQGKADFGELVRSPGFLLSVFAQFVYVGAQVAVWSFFIDFVKATEPGLSEKLAAQLLSGSLALFALGRFSGALVLRFASPPRVLAAYAVLAGICVAAAAALTHQVSIGCLMAVSFFMSIMYPTIFDLGVKSAGRQARLGAAVMVMAIVGGAAVPALLGLSADRLGVRGGYWILIANFALIALYALGRPSPRPAPEPAHKAA